MQQRAQYPVPGFLPVLIVLLLVTNLVLVSPATSQEDSPLEDIFVEEVDVRVVNLEVVVSDGGERVSGLDPSRFRLTVDGEEVPIEFFTEIHEGRSVATPEAPAAASNTAMAAQRTARPAEQVFEPGTRVGTRYLVFIDNVFSVPNRRNQVLRQLAESLTELGPDDSMAIVTYNGRVLDLLANWSSNADYLGGHLEAALKLPTRGQQFRSGEAQVLGTDYNDAGVTRKGGRVHRELEKVIDAAAASMRAFARPEGRKVMLLFSGGWPSPRVALPTSAHGPSKTELKIYEPLIDTANLVGYTLYPLDVHGVDQRLVSAKIGGYSNTAIARYYDDVREANHEIPLWDVAEATGGRPMIDGASLTALPRVVEDTRSYYWIGFTPTWQANDERHRIEVEVDGYDVRSRESFMDLSRESLATLELESARLFDLPMPEAVRLRLAVGPPQPEGRRKMLVPLEVEIPLDEVTLLPTESGYALNLELRVAATDFRGNRSEIPVIPVQLELPTEPGPGQVIVYETPIRMRNESHRLDVSLHDKVGSGALAGKTEVRLD